MICPCCITTVSEFPINGTLGVCPTCARSLVKEGRKVRLATKADILALTGDQVSQLRHARPAAWRNSVRARHARIVGGRG